MLPENRKHCAEICMTLINLLKERDECKRRVRKLSLVAASFTMDGAEQHYTLLCLHLKSLELNVSDPRLKALARAAFLAMPDFTSDELDTFAIKLFYDRARKEMN